MAALKYPGAVSYTHLDVYKRQIVHSADNAVHAGDLTDILQADGVGFAIPAERHFHRQNLLLFSMKATCPALSLSGSIVADCAAFLKFSVPL